MGYDNRIRLSDVFSCGKIVATAVKLWQNYPTRGLFTSSSATPFSLYINFESFKVPWHAIRNNTRLKFIQGS